MEILQEAGLIKESEHKAGQLYDFFRGRLIIPIHNKYGRIIGFTARAMKDDQKPKYLNTPETAIYHKGKSLFGLNWAQNSVKEKGSVYLVEGNADVIRLHQIGIHETVGSSGTALAMDQIQEIKKLCNSITIIGDTDQAGIKAAEKSARLIIGEGMNCNLIRLPAGDTKADPDSHQLYIDQVSKLIKPKKAWQDKLKEFIKEETPEVKKEDKLVTIPEHVSFSDWQKYGFYEDIDVDKIEFLKGM
jgi:DNA primase